MLKKMKTVLAGTLTIAAVGLGVAAYNGVDVTELTVPEEAQSFFSRFYIMPTPLEMASAMLSSRRAPPACVVKSVTLPSK